MDLQAKLKNYTSVYEDLGGAGEELGRYLDQGFARRLPKHLAAQRFGSGTVSRLALITKVKDEGIIKRRIVIDGRSGSRAHHTPEGVDVTAMVRRAWRLRSERMNQEDALDSLEPGEGDHGGR